MLNVLKIELWMTISGVWLRRLQLGIKAKRKKWTVIIDPWMDIVHKKKERILETYTDNYIKNKEWSLEFKFDFTNRPN